jgi:prepilin-type N-terminal cleavage/methylation domain-containing protein
MPKSADYSRLEQGYTLLEVIVVVAVLSAVLIPVSVFFQEYITRMSTADLLVNHQLAKSIMEKTLAQKSFANNDTTITVSRKAYEVTTACERYGDLLKLTVSSRRSRVKDKTIELVRYVYIGRKS